MAAVDDDQPVINVCLSAHGTPKQQLWKHAVLLQQKDLTRMGCPWLVHNACRPVFWGQVQLVMFNISINLLWVLLRGECSHPFFFGSLW